MRELTCNAMPHTTLAAVLLNAAVILAASIDAEVDDERSLAHTNCHGLPDKLLLGEEEGGPGILELLDTEAGRRVAKEAALNVLLKTATRAASVQDILQMNRAITICGNPWIDWLPWIPCRVQSPPPRPDFLDEERFDVGEEPLCWPVNASKQHQLVGD